MKNFKYNRWLVVFIIVGLAAALFVDLDRHKIEQKNMTIEMALDYEGLIELAEIEGVPVDDVLRQAKEAGITSLAVYETTFKKLNVNGKVMAVQGSEILKNYYSGSLVDVAWRKLAADGKILAEDIYITRHDARTFAEVKEDLMRRLGSDRVNSVSIGGSEALIVKANYEKFLKMNIGMPTDEMQIVNDAGFSVVARPSNYEKVDDDDVKAVFKRLDGFDVSAIIFSGSECLGHPGHLPETVKLLKEHDLTLGMIEHPLQLQFYKQEGLIELATALDFKAARVYSIPKDEQLKMKLDAAVERWETTNQERNIRINLLRTFEKPEPGKSLLETNMAYFAKVKEALEAKGFTIGRAGTYDNYYPSRILLVLMTIGAIAAGILYLTLVRPFAAKYQYGLLIVLSVVMTAPILMGSGNLVRSAVALASANLFPALAVIWQLDRILKMKFAANTSLIKIIGTGIIALLMTGAISFVGAAYVGGVLADVRYLLEVNIFRGVKLTFVMPLILVTIAFLQRFDLFDGKVDSAKGAFDQMKKILNAPVYVKSLVALGLAAVAAIVFIGRSGHTAGIPVPGIELKLRAFLEQVLYARPRSKELLIGHPAFMLMMMGLYRKWPTIVFFALVILATIGQGSLVETFAHMRTPIFMSFMRGVGGLVFGAGIGALCMAAAHSWYWWSSYAGRDLTKHE